ncbi:S24 family peptidase [Acetobacter sp. TBRC 12305]|uniref:S24 family peptidase n=2 Tax=Acetobacter garciniae TaxID=2817435 RepID=A0A939KNU2_9PROT|nr:S24 family peptidase [Acetobacter garciniae]MBX0345191.1 S24 family peptidase [Acetobacter garciniae]
MVKAMVPVLSGRGTPPITANEVWNLAGVSAGESGLTAAARRPAPSREGEPHTTHTAVDTGVRDTAGAATGNRTGHADPGQAAPAVLPSQVAIPEYDVITSAGPGMVPVLCAPEDGLRPVEHWNLPRSYIASFTETPDSLAIVRVAGDSMEPDYQAGDRVLVDTAHHSPSPPGVYVLWDGFGLVLKRLELLPGTEHPRLVRIMSINPAYSTYELTLDEISINGRVVGKWTWK